MQRWEKWPFPCLVLSFYYFMHIIYTITAEDERLGVVSETLSCPGCHLPHVAIHFGWWTPCKDLYSCLVQAYIVQFTMLRRDGALQSITYMDSLLLWLYALTSEVPTGSWAAAQLCKFTYILVPINKDPFWRLPFWKDYPLLTVGHDSHSCIASY